MQEIELLIQGLKFIPTFMFVKDVSYEEFLNRLRPIELFLRSKGLWDTFQPWLNLLVPASRISDFNEGVFKGIILKQNTSQQVFVYPTNKSK